MKAEKERIDVAPAPRGELEIDLLALVRSLLARKGLLAAVCVASLAAGWGACQVLPRKFKSTITFAFQATGGTSSRLQQLAMLAGNLNIPPGTSPFVSHLETFAQSREVTGRLMDLKLGDTSVMTLLLRRPPKESDSLYGFHRTLNSVCRIKRKTELFELSCSTRDPALSATLAENLFNTLAGTIEAKRRQSLGRKLFFVDSIVENYRGSYEAASDRLKRFNMTNMGVTSPEMLQKKEALFLEKRISEERYILAIKEQEELRIQQRQEEEPLIVLETAYIPQGPYFPALIPSILAAAAAFLFLYAAWIGWIDRRAWLRPR